MRKKTPYTEQGIKRQKCYRCGKPASEQWNICADNNIYRPICQECDIMLNELVLRWMKDHDWHDKILAYEAKFDKKIYTTKVKK
jgi:hypothetical protein